jgi:hypothetical protein
MIHHFTGGGILRLLVDTDGDFTNATQVTDGTSGVPISYSTGIITVSVTPSLSGSLFPVSETAVFITVAANNGNLAAEGIQFACEK